MRFYLSWNEWPPTVSWKENSSESETGVLLGMENMRQNFVPVPEFGTETYSFSEIDMNLSQKMEEPRIWVLELGRVSNSGIRVI
jgi:hypothetical protein